jgi:hypothetical protein
VRRLLESRSDEVCERHLPVNCRSLSPTSYVSDAGHVYSTALHLPGLDATALKAAGKGKNHRPAMKFVAK